MLFVSQQGGYIDATSIGGGRGRLGRSFDSSLVLYGTALMGDRCRTARTKCAGRVSVCVGLFSLYYGNSPGRILLIDITTEH